MRGLGEAHRDAGADRGGKADGQRSGRVAGGEGGGEDRREGGDGAVHKPRKPRLHPGQDELSVCGAVLLALGLVVEMSLGKLARARLVLRLRRREIAEELAGLRIGGPFRRAAVERLRLALHRLCLAADAVESEVFDEPDWATGVETGDMLAPDERDHRAEPHCVAVDETVAMLILFSGHGVEDCCRGGVVLAQPLRVAAVYARVVLLGGNGQGEDFLFGQVRETATGGKAGDHGGLRLERFQVTRCFRA